MGSIISKWRLTQSKNSQSGSIFIILIWFTENNALLQNCKSLIKFEQVLKLFVFLINPAVVKLTMNNSMK